MYWNDLDGSYLLSEVFSQSVEISEIDVFDIRIDREGCTVIVTFDLINQLPDNPPAKWVKGYNRCRAGINCGGVDELAVSGISNEMRAKIKIKNIDDKIEVNILGDMLNINMKCQHIQFMGPSVYIES